MVGNLLAIRDIKANKLNPGIFVTHTVDEARRHYLELLYAKKDTVFHRHPKDFHLYLLGTINLVTGEIESHVPADVTPHSEVDAYMAAHTQQGAK